MSGSDEVTGVVHTSAFAHLLNRNDAFCLTHSLTQRKVYGGAILKRIYERFRREAATTAVINDLSAAYPESRPEPIIDDLLEKGLLVRGRDDDINTWLRYLHAGQHLYRIRHTYFLPASDCNLRCSYCFIEEEGRGFPTVRMTRDMARKSIDVFAALTRDAERISLTFYGGEPLLNAPVVYDVMHYIRELERSGAFTSPVEVTLLTNGTLVDDETIAAVVETHASVAISIDGPRQLHDSSRRNTGGRGTFDAVMRAHRKLTEAGVRPGMSCTLSRRNIDRIDEIVDFAVDELQPAGIGFNILLPTIGSGNPLDVDHALAADQLISAFRRLREHGMYEDRMMRRVLPFRDGFFHFKDCMGVGGQVVITPDGRIGPCQAFQNIDGYFPWSVDRLHAMLPDIDSDLLYLDPMFDEWRSRFPLNMQACIDCPAIAVCGGGCPYAAQVNHGSIWDIDDRICHQVKKAFEWMIWETCDEMNAASAIDH